MSFVNKKERIFRYGEPLDIPHTRSEARMKKYWSATDRRAWCDEVELRRQHILELNARNKGQFCLENFIPLDILFNAMAANKDDQIEKLQKRIEYLEAMLDVYSQIELTPDQQKQVDDLNKKLAKEKQKLKAAEKKRDSGDAPKPPRRKKGEGRAMPEDGPRRSSSEESIRPRAEKRRRLSSEPGTARPTRRRSQQEGKPSEKKRPREVKDEDRDEAPPDGKPAKKQRTQPPVRPAGRAQAEPGDKGPEIRDAERGAPARPAGRGRRPSREGAAPTKRGVEDGGGTEVGDDGTPKRRKPERPGKAAPTGPTAKPGKATRPPGEGEQPGKPSRRPDDGERGQFRALPIEDEEAVEDEQYEGAGPEDKSKIKGAGKKPTGETRKPKETTKDRPPVAAREGKRPEKTPVGGIRDERPRGAERGEDLPVSPGVRGRGRGRAATGGEKPKQPGREEGPGAKDKEDEEEPVDTDREIKDEKRGIPSPAPKARGRGRGKIDESRERPGDTDRVVPEGPKAGKDEDTPRAGKPARDKAGVGAPDKDRDTPSKAAIDRGRGRAKVEEGREPPGDRAKPGYPGEISTDVGPKAGKPGRPAKEGKDKEGVGAPDKDRDTPSKAAIEKGRGRAKVEEGRERPGDRAKPGYPGEITDDGPKAGKPGKAAEDGKDKEGVEAPDKDRDTPSKAAIDRGRGRAKVGEGRERPGDRAKPGYPEEISTDDSPKAGKPGRPAKDGKDKEGVGAPDKDRETPSKAAIEKGRGRAKAEEGRERPGDRAKPGYPEEISTDDGPKAGKPGRPAKDGKDKEGVGAPDKDAAPPSGVPATRGRGRGRAGVDGEKVGLSGERPGERPDKPEKLGKVGAAESVAPTEEPDVRKRDKAEEIPHDGEKRPKGRGRADREKPDDTGKPGGAVLGARDRGEKPGPAAPADIKGRDGAAPFIEEKDRDGGRDDTKRPKDTDKKPSKVGIKDQVADKDGKPTVGAADRAAVRPAKDSDAPSEAKPIASREKGKGAVDRQRPGEAAGVQGPDTGEGGIEVFGPQKPGEPAKAKGAGADEKGVPSRGRGKEAERPKPGEAAKAKPADADEKGAKGKPEGIDEERKGEKGARQPDIDKEKWGDSKEPGPRATKGPGPTKGEKPVKGEKMRKPAEDDADTGPTYEQPERLGVEAAEEKGKPDEKARGKGVKPVKEAEGEADKAGPIKTADKMEPEKAKAVKAKDKEGLVKVKEGEPKHEEEIRGAKIEPEKRPLAKRPDQVLADSAKIGKGESAKVKPDKDAVGEVKAGKGVTPTPSKQKEDATKGGKEPAKESVDDIGPFAKERVASQIGKAVPGEEQFDRPDLDKEDSRLTPDERKEIAKKPSVKDKLLGKLDQVKKPRKGGREDGPTDDGALETTARLSPTALTKPVSGKAMEEQEPPKKPGVTKDGKEPEISGKAEELPSAKKGVQKPEKGKDIAGRDRLDVPPDDGILSIEIPFDRGAAGPSFKAEPESQAGTPKVSEDEQRKRGAEKPKDLKDKGILKPKYDEYEQPLDKDEVKKPGEPIKRKVGDAEKPTSDEHVKTGIPSKRDSEAPGIAEEARKPIDHERAPLVTDEPADQLLVSDEYPPTEVGAKKRPSKKDIDRKSVTADGKPLAIGGPSEREPLDEEGKPISDRPPEKGLDKKPRALDREGKPIAVGGPAEQEMLDEEGKPTVSVGVPGKKPRPSEPFELVDDKGKPKIEEYQKKDLDIERPGIVDRKPRAVDFEGKPIAITEPIEDKLLKDEGKQLDGEGKPITKKYPIKEMGIEGPSAVDEEFRTLGREGRAMEITEPLEEGLLRDEGKLLDEEGKPVAEKYPTKDIGEPSAVGKELQPVDFEGKPIAVTEAVEELPREEKLPREKEKLPREEEKLLGEELGTKEPSAIEKKLRPREEGKLLDEEGKPITEQYPIKELDIEDVDKKPRLVDIEGKPIPVAGPLEERLGVEDKPVKAEYLEKPGKPGEPEELIPADKLVEEKPTEKYGEPVTDEDVRRRPSKLKEAIVTPDEIAAAAEKARKVEKLPGELDELARPEQIPTREGIPLGEQDIPWSDTEKDKDQEKRKKEREKLEGIPAEPQKLISDEGEEFESAKEELIKPKAIYLSPQELEEARRISELEGEPMVEADLIGRPKFVDLLKRPEVKAIPGEKYDEVPEKVKPKPCKAKCKYPEGKKYELEVTPSRAIPEEKERGPEMELLEAPLGLLELLEKPQDLRPVAKICKAKCNLAKKGVKDEILLRTIDPEEIPASFSKGQQMPEPKESGRPIGICKAKCNLAKSKPIREETTLSVTNLDEPTDALDKGQQVPELKLDAITEEEPKIHGDKSYLEDGELPQRAIMPETVKKQPIMKTETEDQDIYPSREVPLDYLPRDGEMQQRAMIPETGKKQPIIKTDTEEQGIYLGLELPLDDSPRFGELAMESPEEVFMSALSKDDASETKRPDHKCTAPCRNARDRPNVFGEETGGVVLGTDIETPHDLVPPGYFLPDDVSPRAMPEWADVTEMAPINVDALSLSDTDIPTLSETDKAMWVVLKPEKETVEVSKDKSTTLEWDTETEEIVEAPTDRPTIPENIRMGNVMSRVLSGQVVGLPATSPLMEGTSPRTLTEALYQHKLSSNVCRARCANKKIDKDAVDEEPVETIEDVSDINTDSEITDEIYESVTATGTHTEEEPTSEFKSIPPLASTEKVLQEKESRDELNDDILTEKVQQQPETKQEAPQENLIEELAKDEQQGATIKVPIEKDDTDIREGRAILFDDEEKPYDCNKEVIEEASKPISAAEEIPTRREKQNVNIPDRVQEDIHEVSRTGSISIYDENIETQEEISKEPPTELPPKTEESSYVDEPYVTTSSIPEKKKSYVDAVSEQEFVDERSVTRSSIPEKEKSYVDAVSEQELLSRPLSKEQTDASEEEFVDAETLERIKTATDVGVDAAILKTATNTDLIDRDQQTVILRRAVSAEAFRQSTPVSTTTEPRDISHKYVDAIEQMPLTQRRDTPPRFVSWFGDKNAKVESKEETRKIDKYPSNIVEQIVKGDIRSTGTATYHEKLPVGERSKSCQAICNSARATKATADALNQASRSAQYSTDNKPTSRSTAEKGVNQPCNRVCATTTCQAVCGTARTPNAKADAVNQTSTSAERSTGGTPEQEVKQPCTRICATTTCQAICKNQASTSAQHSTGEQPSIDIDTIEKEVEQPCTHVCATTTCQGICSQARAPNANSEDTSQPSTSAQYSTGGQPSIDIDTSEKEVEQPCTHVCATTTCKAICNQARAPNANSDGISQPSTSAQHITSDKPVINIDTAGNEVKQPCTHVCAATTCQAICGQPSTSAKDRTDNPAINAGTAEKGDKQPCTHVCAAMRQAICGQPSTSAKHSTGDKPAINTGTAEKGVKQPCTHVCAAMRQAICGQPSTSAKHSTGDKPAVNTGTVENGVKQPCTHVCASSTEPGYKEDQERSKVTTENTLKLEESLRRLVEPPKAPCRVICATCMISKDEQIELLQGDLFAKDAYCEEQRKIATAALEQLENIKNIVEERDNLRKKLQNSQFELEELKQNLELGFGDAETIEKKSELYVPFRDSNSSITNSCDEEIKNLEDEISRMRASCLSPDQETTVIKKEVEVLKRYCAKLSSIQEENSRLKKTNQELQLKCWKSEEKLEVLGCHGDQSTVEDIKKRLLTLNETIAERDTLQTRVEHLERELNAYQDLPEDIEVFKRRSTLLDEVLKDRDRLAKRVEQMRGMDEELMSLKQKAERVDDLERQLRLATKDVQVAEDEVDSMKHKCAMAEIEMMNQKSETDTLRSKTVCMEHEMESLKSVCKEQELLQIEKDRLQVSLDELVRMQDDYEHMCIQMKGLDVVKAERDRYKRKYEELVNVEGECNMLREQVDKAKTIEKEKELLERQTEDLEKCICEQEDEIRRLVTHIDCLAKGKEDQQVKMKEAVSSLKIELDQKESLLIQSEEKIATMSGKIDTSFHDLSEETTMLRKQKQSLREKNSKLEEENKKLNQENQTLQKEMANLKTENSDLKDKIENKIEENKNLQTQQAEKDRIIETMQEVLSDRETSQSEHYPSARNADEIARLQNELEVAKIENQQLQILATQRESGTNPEADYQLRNMLEQSKTAVERIALELEQQYTEWDCKKGYRCCPGCTCKQKKPPEPKVIIRCCAGCTCKKKTRDPNFDSNEGQSKCACSSRKPKSEDSSPSPPRRNDATQQYPDGQHKACSCQAAKGVATDTKSLSNKCKCVGTGKNVAIEEPSKDSKNTENAFWRSLPIPSDSEDEGEEDQMYTARSAEENKAKIAQLENELLKANDTILQLKEQLGGNERLFAENSALRRHSTEVQEVAKDQIKDLVDHLKKAKDRISELEAINHQLQLKLEQLRNLPEENIKDGPNEKQWKEFPQEKAQVEDLLNHLKKANRIIAELETKNCKLKFDLAKSQNQLNKRDSQTVKPETGYLRMLEPPKDVQEEGAPDANTLVKLQSELDECLKRIAELEAKNCKLKFDLAIAQKQLNKRDSQTVKPETGYLRMLEPPKDVQEEGAPDANTLAKLQSDLDECLKRIAELEANNCKLKFDLAIAQKQLNKRDSQTVKPETGYLRMLEPPKDVQEEGAPDANTLAKLQSELDECLKRIAEVEAKNCKMKFDLAKAQKQLKQRDSQTVKPETGYLRMLEPPKDVQEEGAPDANTLAKLQSELDECLKRIAEVEAKNCKMKFDLAKAQKQLKQRDSQTVKPETGYLRMLEPPKDVQEEGAPDANTLAKLQSELDECLKEREKLLGFIENLKRQLTGINEGAELPDLAVHAQLKTDLEECLKEKQKLLAEIDGLRNKLEKTSETADAELFSKLKADLEMCLKERENLLKIINDLQQQFSSGSKGELPDMTEFAKTKFDLDNSLKENELLLKKLSDLEKELKRCKEQDVAVKSLPPEDKIGTDMQAFGRSLMQDEHFEDMQPFGRNMMQDEYFEDLQKPEEFPDMAAFAKLKAELENALKEKGDLAKALENVQKSVVSDQAQDLPDMAAFAKIKSELEDCLKEKDNLLNIIKNLEKQLTSDGKTQDLPDMAAFAKMQLELEECLKEKDNLLKTIKDLQKQLAAGTTQDLPDMAEFAKMKLKLEESLKEKDNLLKTIKDLEKLASGTTQDLPDMAEFAKMKLKLEECLKEKDNLLKTIKDLEKQLASGTTQDLPDMAEFAKIKLKLEECLKERDNLLKTIKDLEKPLASGKTQDLPDLTAFIKTKQELEDSLKEKNNLLNIIEDLKKQLAAEKANKDKLQNELENVRKEKENLSKVNESLKKQQPSGIVDDQSDLSNIKAQLDKCLKEKQELLNKIDDLQKQMTNGQLELQKLQKEKEALQKSNDDLKIMSDQLKKEKDNLDNMLMSNVVTTSRRSSKLENEISDFANENKKLLAGNETLSKNNKDLENRNKDLMAQIAALRNENDKLKAEIAKYKDDNSKLKAELDNLKKAIVDPSILEKLQKENEQLKKQLESKQRELNDLLDKMKLPSISPVDKSLLEKDQKDKDAMQSTIKDLEDQLKNLMNKEKIKPVEPVDDLKGKIHELMKQLEEAQKRAEAAEDALRKLKASDPTAMLNAELQKLKDRIAGLEKENANLQSALSQVNDEKAKLRKDLENSTNDAKKFKDESNALRKIADDLKADKDHINKDMQKLSEDASGTSALRDDNAKLKKRAGQLEEDVANLKREMDLANAETKKAVDKMNQLMNENGDLKKKLAQMEGENAKMKKNLDTALDDARKAAERLLEIEKENAKCKQTVKDLEAEVAKLKKELDGLLNDAKKGTNTVADLQKEIAALKQKVAQLEGLNASLKDENAKLKKELDQARGGSQVVASLQDENNKIQQQNNSLQAEIDKLKKELESALANANAKTSAATQLQNELSNLNKKLQQLEAENAELKKKLAAAKTDTKMDDLQNNYDKLRQKLAEMENENTKLKKDLQKAADEAKKMSDELNTSRQNEKKCKDKINQLEGDNDKLKKDLNKTLDDLKKMGTEVSGIQGDESKFKQKSALLDTENAKLKKDLEIALENARKASGEASSLKDENSKLKQRIAQLESENAKLKSELDSALNDLKKATNQIKELQEGNNKYKQQMKQMEDETAKLKQKIEPDTKGAKPAAVSDDNAKQLLENELNKLKKDLEAARKEAKDNGQESAKLKDENGRLQQKIKQLEAENAKLKKDLDDALKAIKGAEAELAQLRNNEAKLKGQLSQMENNNNKLQKEKAALAEDVKKAGTDLAKLSELKDNENRLKQRIAQLEAENAKLKKDLDAALNDAKKFGDELSNVRSDNNKLKQQLSKMEGDNKKLKNDLDQAVVEAKKGAFGVSDLKEVDDKLKQRIAQLEAENANLKSELDKALNNSKKYVGDLSKLQDEDNKLKQKLAQLELENSKLKKDLERALGDAKAGTDGTADLRNEISKLKQKIPALESEINNLKKQLESALNDAKSKTAGMSKCQDEINNLKQKLAQLEKNNDNLKKELADALKDRKLDAETGKKSGDENNKLKQRISQLENEIGELKKQLEAAKVAPTPLVTKTPEDEGRKRKLEQLDEENAKLKKERDNAIKEAQRAASLQDENGKLKQQISKLQSDLDKLKKDLDSAINEAKKSASELAKIKENEAQLKQKVAQLESENVKLKKELDEAKNAAREANTLRNENKELKAQIKQLQDEISKLKSQVKSAVATVEPPVDEINALKDELAKLKQKNANLQTENAKINQQNDQLKSSLQSAERASSDLKKEVDALKQANKNLQAKVDELTKQLQMSKNLPEENEKLKRKIEQLEQELAKLKKELSAATSELSKANENLNKLKDENGKLKSDNLNLKTTNGKMENDLKASKDALNNATKKLENIDDKNFEKQFADYEKQIKLLNAEIEKQKKECQDTIASLKAQFDRDMKNLLKKNEENIDKLQKAHAENIRDLNDKHEKEVKDLRNALEKLRQELEAILKEKERLRSLLDDQKKKSIDIKGKVEEVEKVINKERRRSKELEKKHSELKSIASALEQEITNERKRSVILKKEKSELSDKLEESFTEKKIIEGRAMAIEDEKDRLARENKEIKKEGELIKKESVIIQKLAEEERKKSKDLEFDMKLMEAKLKDQLIPISEVGESKSEIQTDRPRQRKVKDEKLTMTTFETISVAPSVVPISIPLSDNELAFYGKKPCPCANTLDQLLKKAAIKGFAALTIEELQFIHKNLSEATADILERMGQKTGVLRPTEVGDRLSLLRRIAELEGDLLRKQNQTQQKIAQMQNAVKLEKDRLSELRKNLEKEKRAPSSTSDSTRKRISRDSKVLEEMENQLEQRLKAELLNKMRLTKRLSHPCKAREESPVRDISTSQVSCTTTKSCCSRTPHSTGKL